MTSPSPLAADRRARTAVALLFLAFGGTMGSWLARVPDVKARLSLDDSEWGLVAVATTGGTFLAMATVAVLVHRIGARRLTRVAAPALLLVAPFVASASTPVQLAGLLALLGLCAGFLQAPINAQAYAVQAGYGRPIMSSFHACFSVGALVGGLLGAWSVAVGMTPTQQLALTGTVFALALAVTSRHQPADVPRDGAASGRRFTPELVLLCFIAFCGSLAEGSASQWSAIYVSETLAAGAAAGAIAYACFTGMMTVGRAFGDRLVHRLGRRRFLRGSALLAAVGLGSALAVGTPAAAFLGFAALGLGLACVVPTLMSAAGDQPGMAPSQGISTLAVAAWPAFLIGPPLIGWLSSLLTLGGALVLPVLGATVVAALAHHVRQGVSTGPAVGAGAGVTHPVRAGARA